MSEPWPQPSIPLQLLGHYRRFQQGLPPSDLEPYMDRWNETSMESPCEGFKMLRVTRAATVLWYRIESLNADGTVNRGRMLVVGPFDSSAWVPITQANENVLIFLRPGATRAVLGMPAHVLSNHRVPITEVWGADGQELEQRLAQARCHFQRREVLAQAIRTRLSRQARPDDLELVQCIRALRQPLRVKSVREPYGWSARQLERLCAQGVGMGLKRLSILLRAGDAMRQACRQAAPDWTGLALDHGFYDQSHLTHAMRRVFGQPPGRFHAIVRSGAHWVDGMVTFPGRQP